jgi:hypothetical protein
LKLFKKPIEVILHILMERELVLLGSALASLSLMIDAALVGDGGEPEDGSKATILGQQRLREHLILAKITVRHRAPRRLHHLFKVSLSDLRHWIFVIFHLRDKHT